MKNQNPLRIIASVILLGQLSYNVASAGIIYDAATDFSSTSNPNGVWSYGWSQTLGGTFNIDTDEANSSGLSQWRGDLAPDGNPSVIKNNTASEIDLGTVVFPALSIVFHPGPGGEYSIVRFTAPTAGDYSLSSLFTGQDVDRTTTDVHILDNGVSIFSGNVTGFLTTTTVPSQILSLQVGDTVDFEVHYGDNGTFFNDSTGLQARLTTTAVPEPTTIVAGALLLLPFGASTMRRFLVSRK